MGDLLHDGMGMPRSPGSAVNVTEFVTVGNDFRSLLVPGHPLAGQLTRRDSRPTGLPQSDVIWSMHGEVSPK